MATWTDPEKRVWNYSAEKLDFDAWLEDAPERIDTWHTACVEHMAWITANPGKPGIESPGQAGAFFQQWVDYAGAYWIAE